MTRAPNAVVLAAGLGTRLRPLTDKTPKCLLPLGGRPILELWLDKLAALGVEQAFVNGHHHWERVLDHVTERGRPPAVRFMRETTLLGSGGTVAARAAELRAGPAFWICYADTWIGDDLAPLLRKHEEAQAELTLGVFRAERPEECGILDVDSAGRVLSFVEKPKAPRSDLAFAGVAVAGPAFLDCLPKVPFKIPLDLGRQVLPKAVAGGAAWAARLERVFDIGTPERYERAQREFR